LDELEELEEIGLTEEVDSRQYKQNYPKQEARIEEDE